MDKPYIEIPVLETPFIMVPTREPKLWGITKILLYAAMVLMFFAFAFVSELLGTISILIFSFLFVYSEDLRRIVRVH